MKKDTTTNSTPVMRFHIDADPASITELHCPHGAVSMIPFTGWVQSDLFNGEVLPGAADVQIENPAGIRNMCAKYIFRGTDFRGQDCLLFVENNGWFNGTERFDPVLYGYPTFLTDSSALGEYLSRPSFRSEIRAEESGLEIWIYDVCGTPVQYGLPGTSKIDNRSVKNELEAPAAS